MRSTPRLTAVLTGLALPLMTLGCAAPPEHGTGALGEVATAAEQAQPAQPDAASFAAELASRLESATLIDLTYTYDEDTVYWPTAPSTFDLHQDAYGETDAGFFYASNSFCTPEHGGTHLDAPIHFAAGKMTSDQLPLESLLSPAVVIDIAAQAAANPDYVLSAEDVLAWEAEHGMIEAGTIVMLRTGWGAKWPDRKAYLGDDTPGDASNLHFPSYGEASARLLVEERKVAVLGVDTASIDHGPSRDFIAHQIANRADVPGLENVANLHRLPPRGAYVIALPMKIGGGSGGPVRIVALLG
ncbi:MAG: cyclase family protein [Acidobacteriota bacterium]